MLSSATLMFRVDSEVQPAKFGSIPRFMWWAVVTQRTLGIATSNRSRRLEGGGNGAAENRVDCGAPSWLRL